MSDERVQAALEILSEDECRRLLEAHHVGRIGLVQDGQPLILPVNYVADGEAVAIRTAPGTKFDWAPMTKVAFEIDEVDLERRVAWSVLVKGFAYDVTGALDRLSERLRTLVVRPMAPGDRELWIAVLWQEISGRRFPIDPDVG